MKRYSHYLSLIFQKASADLVSEARRGYMGMLWWIVEPILYMGVFYVVFVVVLDRGGEDRVSFLLIGLVVWKWFAATIPQSANSIYVNRGLIGQVYIPKFVFPGMVATTSTLKFLIVFVLLVGFLLITGKSPSIEWLSIPLLMGVQLVMMLALGGILASIVPFLPDLKLIIDNGMMLLFFLSGIFFDIGHVSSDMKNYLYLNPMLGIVEAYRDVLLRGAWPDWTLQGKIFLISSVGFVVAWKILQKYDRVYAKVL